VIVPAQEVRTPVDVVTAGRALLELAGSKQTGIFHLAGNERLNRMEMAQRIAARLGLNAALIKPQSPTEPAIRFLYSRGCKNLRNHRWSFALIVSRPQKRRGLSFVGHRRAGAFARIIRLRLGALRKCPTR